VPTIRDLNEYAPDNIDTVNMMEMRPFEIPGMSSFEVRVRIG
jgi:hypothetical protein